MKYVKYFCGSIVNIQKSSDGYTILTVAKDVSNIYTYMVLVASDKTLVINGDCNEINLDDLNLRDVVFAYHSNAMTRSIPPQSTVYIIEVKN